MLKTLIKILIVLGITYLVFQIPVSYAYAPEIAFEDWTAEQKVEFWAEHYNASEQEMKRVITCESGWQPEVKGDGGKAYSYAQFHEPTFNMWAKELNKDLSYSNPDDHLELMAYAFSKGSSYKKHWTCWTKLYR